MWFGDVVDGVEGPGVVGDRQTLWLGDVRLAVQASEALRRQILGTLRTVTEDHNGCAANDRAIRDLTWRPVPAGRVDELTGVRSVAACKYGFAKGQLLGSLRLEGSGAAGAVARVAASPVGGGPDAPASCAEDVAYGEGLVVLQVDADQGRSRIALRYDGCDHHGFDDGTAVRTLTRDAVAPFIGGPNRVLSFSGELSAVLTRRG